MRGHPVIGCAVGVQPHTARPPPPLRPLCAGARAAGRPPWQGGRSLCARRFPILCGPMLAEIVLICHICSCHEMLRVDVRAGVLTVVPVRLPA
jgi:hypothetical protein